MDGGQKATHVLARGLGAVTSPVKPLQSLVHAGGGVVSNVLGSSSRLLGKPVLPPRSVVFLYSRQLNNVDGPNELVETVKLVLGHALSNVILHSEDMDSEEPINLKKMSVLHGVAVRLQKANAHERDIYDVVKVLGRNGRADLPDDLEAPVGTNNFRAYDRIETDYYCDVLKRRKRDEAEWKNLVSEAKRKKRTFLQINSFLTAIYVYYYIRTYAIMTICY